MEQFTVKILKERRGMSNDVLCIAGDEGKIVLFYHSQQFAYVVVKIRNRFVSMPIENIEVI